MKLLKKIQGYQTKLPDLKSAFEGHAILKMEYSTAKNRALQKKSVHQGSVPRLIEKNNFLPSTPNDRASMVCAEIKSFIHRYGCTRGRQTNKVTDYLFYLAKKGLTGMY